jgi:hypothetical protein
MPVIRQTDVVAPYTSTYPVSSVVQKVRLFAGLFSIAIVIAKVSAEKLFVDDMLAERILSM